MGEISKQKLADLVYKVLVEKEEDMNKRTKALAISPSVKAEVALRDSLQGCPCCIFCGAPYALPEMHYISRAQGGLGIPENIACGCRQCHYELDHTSARKEMLEYFKKYLQEEYPGWNEEMLVYKKGVDYARIKPNI